MAAVRYPTKIDHAGLTLMKKVDTDRIAAHKRKSRLQWREEKARMKNITRDRSAVPSKLAPLPMRVPPPGAASLPDVQSKPSHLPQLCGGHQLSPIRRHATARVVLNGFRGSQHGITVEPLPSTRQSRETYFRDLGKQRRKNGGLPSLVKNGALPSLVVGNHDDS